MYMCINTYVYSLSLTHTPNGRRSPQLPGSMGGGGKGATGVEGRRGGSPSHVGDGRKSPSDANNTSNSSNLGGGRKSPNDASHASNSSNLGDGRKSPSNAGHAGSTSGGVGGGGGGWLLAG